jgi:hypothetical protein
MRNCFFWVKYVQIFTKLLLIEVAKGSVQEICLDELFLTSFLDY